MASASPIRTRLVLAATVAALVLGATPSARAATVAASTRRVLMGLAEAMAQGSLRFVGPACGVAE